MRQMDGVQEADSPRLPVSASARLAAGDTMQARRLIFNADDLGYSRGVNRAIARCARDGLLRSATLMAGGDAFDHALESIESIPGLGVGVHLTMTELAPVSTGDCQSGLVAASGLLRASGKGLYPLVIGSRAVRESLKEELGAQVEKILSRGIQPTHVDSHKHLHAFPGILEVVLDVAKEYGIRWVRNPFDDTPIRMILGLLPEGDRPTFRRQSAAAWAIRVFESHFKARARRRGLNTSSRFYGIGLTGIWNRAALTALIDRLPDGITEFMFHPGDCDADLRSRHTRLLEQREVERDLLLSDSVRKSVQDRQISLTHYGEMVA